jgi:hypothetical protein
MTTLYEQAAKSLRGNQKNKIDGARLLSPLRIDGVACALFLLWVHVFSGCVLWLGAPSPSALEDAHWAYA